MSVFIQKQEQLKIYQGSDSPIGVIVRLNNVRALVRISLKADECYGKSVHLHPYKEEDLYISLPMRPGMAGNEVKLGSVIQINSYTGPSIITSIEERKQMEPFKNPKKSSLNTVTSFSIIEGEIKKDELLIITHKRELFWRIIGGCFDSEESVMGTMFNHRLNEWNDVDVHDIFYGNTTALPVYYRTFDKNSLPEISFDHDVRMKYLKRFAKATDKLNVYEDPSNYRVTSYRHVNDDESSAIRTQSRCLASLSLENAIKFVRDPMLAASCLKEYLSNLGSSYFTATVNIASFDALDETSFPPKHTIEVRNGNDPVQSGCAQGTRTWRVGSKLALSNRDVLKHGSVSMKIVSISEGVIVLQGEPGSEVALHALSKYNTVEGLDYQLGPAKSNDYMKRTAIKNGFENICRKNYNLFMQSIGRQERTHHTIHNADFNWELVSDLDASQLEALRTSLTTSGFTCVEAPPGSGKTHLISAIVATALRSDRDMHMAIVSETNSAINIAMEKCFARISNETFVRQFALSAESELETDSKLRSISPRHLLSNKDIVKELSRFDGFKDALRKKNRAKERLDRHVGTFEDQCDLIWKYQKAERELSNAFVTYYDYRLYGATCAISSSMELEKITHLIIDEASQLSPVDALATYCSFPDLRKVTIIGDRHQLGPYCEQLIRKGTLLHTLLSTGELMNVGDLATSVRVDLQFIYRCHPNTVDFLFKPIYGEGIRSGTEIQHRNMAQIKKLPVANDGSLVVFVQVDGEERHGVNWAEVTAVGNFIQNLKKKGVSEQDIVIIVHHKAQKAALQSAMRDKLDVQTVDSFQGREGKIVLVLTTKTNEDNLAVLDFVSNPNCETVAITRSQHGVYLFGNWTQLLQKPFWSKFRTENSQRGAMKTPAQLQWK